MDEVARAFLEHSLVDHKSGRLPIHSQPTAQRMTLYPNGEPEAVQPSKAWLRDAFSSQQPGKKRKQANQPKRWESRVWSLMALIENSPRSPEQIWSWIQTSLRADMPRSNYDSWVQPARAVSFENDRFVIGCFNDFGRRY